MRIGAYQFPVTGNITENMSHILDAVSRASREGVSGDRKHHGKHVPYTGRGFPGLPGRR